MPFKYQRSVKSHLLPKSTSSMSPCSNNSTSINFSFILIPIILSFLWMCSYNWLNIRLASSIFFLYFSSGKLYGLVVPIYKQNKNLFRRAHWYLAKTQIKKYQLPFFCSIRYQRYIFQGSRFFFPRSNRFINRLCRSVLENFSNVMGLWVKKMNNRQWSKHRSYLAISTKIVLNALVVEICEYWIPWSSSAFSNLLKLIHFNRIVK
jgi:hypothetical protein